jgi:AmmeMemoRadiSam system protein A
VPEQVELAKLETGGRSAGREPRGEEHRTMATGELSVADRRRLVEIAREALRARAQGAAPRAPDDCGAAGGRLAEECGAFVSLHTRSGRLRGCIGCFCGRGALTETVAEMAVSAGFHDPRFAPVDVSELDDLELEISVLSPLRPVATPEEIEVGRHGIQISRGSRRGVLLPQVATKYGWDRERFLEETCWKAGLPRDAWRDPTTTIQVFTADVFSEDEVRADGEA